MKTYLNSVRSFDHRELADLPAYARLRQAIDDLAHYVEDRGGLNLTLDDWLAAARDMALTAPYADCCEHCGQRAWPHAVDRQGDWLTAPTAVRPAAASGSVVIRWPAPYLV